MLFFLHIPLLLYYITLFYFTQFPKQEQNLDKIKVFTLVRLTGLEPVPYSDTPLKRRYTR